MSTGTISCNICNLPAEHHSTEMVLSKVKTDILKSMDNQEIICSVLFYPSAAFDMGNNKILNKCLHNRFGLKRHNTTMD